MKRISSRDNPIVKELRRAAAGGGRRNAPVLLDGVHLCRAWLQHVGSPEHALFDEERLQRPELAALAAELPYSRCLSLAPALMRSIAAVESGQGVAFVVHAPQPELPATIDGSCLLLDRVQDPGNVGALLRTCAAAGIARVLLSTGSAAAWSPKVLRSAQGAHFALTIHEHVDLHAVLPSLVAPIAATALQEATSLYETELPRACAWIFGNEGQGVDAGLLRAARYRVRIPHEDAAVESLNVAAAAAICLFEQRRRYLAGPGQ
jgi:TrmH family RNA methyltransferase